jgi:hypothetical protein
MRHRLLLAAVLGAMLSGLSGQALADVFEPIQLASESPLQQADYAHHPAISGDGRYVAFDGSFGGVIGVWRRDLLTGAVDSVVACASGTSPESSCAELPSISADGRYVSFTSTSALDPRNDVNAAPDVYVRDMDSATPCSAEREEGEECEYALASARSGSSAGLSYTYGGEREREEPRYGSLASGRSALTADGRHVVFVTTAESDLHGERTPMLQVAVRDLDTRVTRLVSVQYDPSTGESTENPVPTSPEGGGVVGAVYPGGGALPVFGTAGAAYAGASISADGSTVAWMGQQIAEQAPVLPDEGLLPGYTVAYTEPLWRRIADGAHAPVRRITGGGDPASAACAASGERAPVFPPTLADACQGPFDPTYSDGSAAGIWVLGSTEGDYLPQLSASGQIVAFLSSAREIAAGEAFTSQPSSDLYVADMRVGSTRVQALRRLTELAGGSLGEVALTGPVVDLGISQDGSQVAFSTRRTVFPLGFPAYVSAPASEAGIVEVYSADLSNNTLTRVTQGFAGEQSGPSGSVSGSPSFSSDDTTVAFSSTAANLVYGDGNAPDGGVHNGFDGSDAFVVRRKALAATTPETFISAPPEGPPLVPVWRLGVTAHSRRDGSVLLEVVLPGAGVLNIRARGAVPQMVPARSAGRKRGHRSSVIVAMRTLASTRSVAHEAGVMRVVLTLSPAYRSLAARRGGLSGELGLSFLAPGHAAASASTTAAFVRRALSSSRAARRGSHRTRSTGARA